MSAPSLRVLVVDDLATVRAAVRRMLESRGFTVAGEAADGEAAVAAAAELKPDVILMDVHMPRLGGLEATREVMHLCPTPILIFTSTAVTSSSAVTFAALAAGALDVFPKPRIQSAAEFDTIADALAARLRLLAGVKVIRRYPRQTSPSPRAWTPKRQPASGLPRLLALGASTGGPPALVTVLKALPPGLPAPILLVQHMAAEFMPGFVSWLGSVISLPVKAAGAGDALRPGVVFVAPGDQHLRLEGGGRLALDRSAPLHSCRPAVDALFDSVAAHAGPEAIGVLLTGMGEDGAAGLLRMREAGALTVAQDEASCAVYGMPRAAAERGAAASVLALSDIGPFLRERFIGATKP